MLTHSRKSRLAMTKFSIVRGTVCYLLVPARAELNMPGCCFMETAPVEYCCFMR